MLKVVGGKRSESLGKAVVFLMVGGWDWSRGSKKKEQTENPSPVESDISLNFYQGPLYGRCPERD